MTCLRTHHGRNLGRRTGVNHLMLYKNWTQWINLPRCAALISMIRNAALESWFVWLSRLLHLKRDVVKLTFTSW